MHTTLPTLPEQKQAEINAIVAALIPRFAEVEMIILFGSYARGEQVDDLKKKKGNTYSYRSDYDLLIILSKNGHANSNTLTQSISTRLKDLKLKTRVNPIYHGMEFINHELSEGNYFFGDIKKEGVLLFTTNRYQLSEKRDMSPAELQAKAQKDFDKWFMSANTFFEDFENNFKKVEELRYRNNAAFHLHQSAERYYGAIQLVFTAYKPKTHDLEELGDLAKACDMAFSKAFPQATDEEQTRFDLLRRAYVESRYSDDYAITKQDLEYLAGRVQILRTLTEQICKEKVVAFTK